VLSFVFSYTEDFTGPEFNVLHRFCREDLMSVALKRLVAPTPCLHINNMPQGTTANRVRDLFFNSGVEIKDFFAVKKRKEKVDPNPSSPSRAMLFIQLKNKSDSVIGMSLVGGALSSSAIPAGLRVSFTESSVLAEREKNANNTKMEILDNNQPL
jgi:hypothetical protein